MEKEKEENVVDLETVTASGDFKPVQAATSALQPQELPNGDKLLNLAVIGTGNCGCMMANVAARDVGLDVIGINGSKRDLDLLKYIPNNCKFQVGDGKGTGKDRAKAKEFFLADSGLTLDPKMISLIENNDVIFVCCSTGGGYGSGSSTELLEALTTMYPDKNFVAVGVLPFADEGYAAFNGTKDWFKELLTLNIPYMLYVNELTDPKMTREDAAEHVNREFVQHLMIAEGDWLGRTLTGGIDERDMLTIFSVPGRIVVLSTDTLEVSDVESNLIKTLKSNLSGNVELVNDKQIAASALMYRLGTEFNEFKATIKTDLQEEFGEHIKDMTNFTDEEGGSSIALIAAGLTEPTMVIDRILSKLQKMGETITTRKSATSKLDKFSDTPNKLLDVTAKQSFATETPVVAAATTGASGNTREELLQKFLAQKAQKTK